MTVHDVNSVCNILWVSRAQPYAPDTLSGSTAEVARHFAGPTKGNTAEWLATDYGSDVLSCTTHKDVESPVGVFSFSLRPHDELRWDKKLKPGDVVYIWMGEDQRYTADQREQGKLVMVGIIDRVTIGSSMSGDGADTTGVSVSGRDIGVIFQETATVFDPAFAVAENLNWTQDLVNNLFGKRPALSPLENVLGLITMIYTGVIGSSLVASQWSFNVGSEDLPVPQSIVSLIDVTTFMQAPIVGYMRPQSYSIQEAGNVWDLLKRYTNSVINEFFFDVRDYSPEEVKLHTHLSAVAAEKVTSKDAGLQKEAVEAAQKAIFASQLSPPPKDGRPVLAMVLRQRPYDTDAFGKLPTTDIFDHEIIEDDSGYSYHDVFNFFGVKLADLGAQFQEISFGIYVNAESVARYGIRRLAGETIYMFTDSGLAEKFDKGGGGPPKEIFHDVFEYYTSLLATWFVANDRLASGTITMRFRPSIRVGTRVRVFKEGSTMLYYVSDVQHSFGVDAGVSRTTLTVIRGIPEYPKTDDPPSTLLVHNLRWRDGHCDIPQGMNPIKTYTATDLTLKPTRPGGAVPKQAVKYPGSAPATGSPVYGPAAPPVYGPAAPETNSSTMEDQNATVNSSSNDVEP